MCQIQEKVMLFVFHIKKMSYAMSIFLNIHVTCHNNLYVPVVALKSPYHALKKMTVSILGVQTHNLVKSETTCQASILN